MINKEKLKETSTLELGIGGNAQTQKIAKGMQGDVNDYSR
jgi:hypothetical protein